MFAANSALHAQLPVARLTSLFPVGGRAGSTVEVAIAGADLDDVARLVFSHTNIVAFTNSNDRFSLAIRDDVPPGIYDARVVGRYGISNPRAFVVSDLIELIEAPGNTTASNAMELTLGSIVNARTDANAADYFKVRVGAGQRVFFECAAQAIDSRCLPVLTLYDDAGRELARDRNGALVDFTAAQDVATVIKVHDVLFRGGAEYHYRLAIRTGPRVEFILPAAAIPGTTNRHTVYGRNIPGSAATPEAFSDGKRVEQLSVDVAAPSQGTAGLRLIESAGIDGFHHRVETTNGLSKPLFIGLAEAPVVLEMEPNSTPDQSQRLVPPCEVSGRFHPAGDQDWFTFDAKKGEVYWIEVLSHRLGCATDPFLLVQRVSTNGSASDLKEVYDVETLDAGDFKANPRDPGWRLDVTEDGVHRVQVRDLFNRIQASPNHTYRLAILRDGDAFDLVAGPETPIPPKSDSKDVRLWPTFLRRGDTAAVRVTALRRGYGDNIELAVEGLPPGVTAPPARIPAGKNFGLLLLTAAEDAAGWVGSVKIVGTGKSGTREIRSLARAAMLIHPVEDKTKEPLHARLSDGFTLAVSSNEVAPLAITAAEDKTYEVGATGKLSLPLRIHRRGDFTEALKLKPAPSSAFESLAEFEVASKATNATVEIDPTKHKLAPGEHVLFFRGQTKGKYRKNPEAVVVAEQQLKDAEKRISDFAAELKKAETNLASLSAEAKTAAEKALADLKAELKDAESQKSAIDAVHKKATETAKPREVTITVYSAPVRIRVTEEKKVASQGKE